MMKVKKFLNEKERAITLIALIVTIIVLMILAGVSIQMLTGENGIITKVQQAKNSTEIAKVKEEQDLADMYAKMLLATEGDVPDISTPEYRTWLTNFINNTVNNDLTSLSGRITTLENSNNNSITMNDVLDRAYPVGSVYISTSSIDPSTLFGGNWEQLEDKFLLGAGTTYTAGSIGGSSTHQHLYGLQYVGYCNEIGIEGNGTNVGLLNYSDGTNFTLTGHGTSMGQGNRTVNNGAESNGKTVSALAYRMTANTSVTTNMPPYVVVYMWKRLSDSE